MNLSSELKLQLFSNPYYEFVNNFVKSDFEDSKVLGKFYTNIKVAENLARDVLLNYNWLDMDVIRIIDPFCGDGRLIVALLENMKDMGINLKTKVKIVAWDIDSNAVSVAEKNIKQSIDELKIDAMISVETKDSYIVYSDMENTFDICITNPPWGLLKPQKIFNDRCNSGEIEEYKSAISSYDEYMKNEFVLSKPTRQFGRWGTNLGRIGTEVALRLTATFGICGVVSPATLFNDQVSYNLRKWIFEQHHIHAISYYPAELKLYDGADVSSITFVASKGFTFHGFSIDNYRENMNSVKVNIDENTYEFISKNKYTVPLGESLYMMDILQLAGHLPTVEEYCLKYNLFFTRELDETRVDSKVLSTGRIIFAKGYMVDRYTFLPEDKFLDESVVTPPSSVFKWKLVWRDVSRNSQKRRIRATLLSPMHIAGNSLGMICCREKNSLEKLKCLLGIMNSMVFEIQARCFLITNHVSAGIIKQLHIPNNIYSEKLIELVDEQLEGHDKECEIEVLVARLYGLSKQQIEKVINIYDIENEDRIRLHKLLNSEYGDDV